MNIKHQYKKLHTHDLLTAASRHFFISPVFDESDIREGLGGGCGQRVTLALPGVNISFCCVNRSRSLQIILVEPSILVKRMVTVLVG